MVLVNTSHVFFAFGYSGTDNPGDSIVALLDVANVASWTVMDSPYGVHRGLNNNVCGRINGGREVVMVGPWACEILTMGTMEW